MSLTYAHPRGAVLADVLLAKRSLTTDLALIGAGTAVVAVLAQVSVPLWPVPVTGQTLGVIMVGAALGAKRGAAALSLYLIAGLAGLPIFANLTGGPLSILKPSFGFIIGFIGAAFVVGWIAERQWDRKFWKALAGFALASAIPFIIGVPYLALVLGGMGLDNSVPAVIAAGVTPFIIGGIAKAAIAAAVTPLAWRGVKALDVRSSDPAP